MKVTITIEVDTAAGKQETSKLADVLRYLQDIAKSEEPFVEDEVEPTEENERREVDPSQLERLKLLQEGLTEKQREVWEVFMNHPGAISASKLKKLLPDLNKPGALPGVFRAIHRWTNQLGGEKARCPFNQVKWTGSEGIYRGLWQEEVGWLR